jgi:hypothetical protein
MFNRASDLDGFFGMKHSKMNIRFGTWNIRSLCWTGLLKMVAREVRKCKLNIVGVQEVRWEKSGTEQAFLYGEGNEDHQLGTGSFIQNRIISAVRRVTLVCDRKLYITLRGHWRTIIVLNVQATCEDRSDDIKDSFYEESGCVFDPFPR